MNDNNNNISNHRRNNRIAISSSQTLVSIWSTSLLMDIQSFFNFFSSLVCSKLIILKLRVENDDDVRSRNLWFGNRNKFFSLEKNRWQYESKRFHQTLNIQTFIHSFIQTNCLSILFGLLCTHIYYVIVTVFFGPSSFLNLSLL